MVVFRPAESGQRSWIFPQCASQWARIVVAALTLVLLIGIALWLGANAHLTHRSSRFLIPEGYTGWVRVEFEVPGAPPLPQEAGQYVFKIPTDGILRTSSPEQYGWAEDHYFYRSSQGMQPLADSRQNSLIWGKINGEKSGASGKQKYEEFFVGTAEQFNRSQGK
jgi:hypothetical protein